MNKRSHIRKLAFEPDSSEISDVFSFAEHASWKKKNIVNIKRKAKVMLGTRSNDNTFLHEPTLLREYINRKRQRLTLRNTTINVRPELSDRNSEDVEKILVANGYQNNRKVQHYIYTESANPISHFEEKELGLKWERLDNFNDEVVNAQKIDTVTLTDLFDEIFD